MPELSPTRHVDTFTRDRILAVDPWPDLRLPGPWGGDFNATTLFVDGPAAAYPDRTALITDAGEWTYAEFAARVNRSARILAEDLALRPGQRVLLRGRNGPWFAVWLHGVLKAGGVVVPVSARLRSAEIAQIVDICEASFVLCDAADADITAAVPILTYPDDLHRRASRRPDAFDTVATAADDVALLAFSSGTTGVPKATMHFHRDLAYLTHPARRDLMGVRPGTLIASNRPMTFPYALVGLCMMPLRYGATALARHFDDVAEFFAAVEDRDARIVLSDPGSYRAAEAPPGGERAYYSCAEALSPTVARRWHERTGSVLRNALGVTEHLWLVTGATPLGDRPGSVGVPLPRYDAAVFDAAGDPCGPGTPGRLGVRGPTGVRLIDPEQQRAAVHRGYTLTGDWAHLDADGYVWLYGRTDDMVKVRGILVAPAEIENVLLAHPAIGAAAALGLRDAERGDRMHAYVTLRSGADADAVIREVRSALDARLADYRRPERLEVLPEMPYGPTGKIDRRALRERSGRPLVGEEHDT
ncbi:AMP-binding protein [Actinoallomurus iriomotensis]|uniref:AMP-binding protein n=1 Tax=Actinoallomurus iriomotensis TaxID=478107 RepID=UPI002556101E|nr:AMP-binding protein [Actinoallomurus iriomotensis]